MNVERTIIRTTIDAWLDQAEARGWNTYGKSLEDADDGRDWNYEMICELIDALQYAAKQIHDLQEQLRNND